MANPITVPLPADLPTDWSAGDTVAPNGADAGLSEQHGYNYLMEQVNNAQTAVLETAQAMDGLFVVGGTEPEHVPVFWFDTSKTGVQVALLSLEGPGSGVSVEVESVGTYPIENATLNQTPKAGGYNFDLI